VPGVHNVLNATAAVAVALELDQKPDAIREALATFSGVDRRFQIRGAERGVTVVDDYGIIRPRFAPRWNRRDSEATADPGVVHRTATRAPAFLMDEFAGAFNQSTGCSLWISTPLRKNRSRA